MTFVLVAPLEERVRLDQINQLLRVRRVAGDDQHERLHDHVAAFAGVGFQFDLHAFVQPDAVLQLHLLDRLRRHAGGIEVLARDDGRLLDEAVRHRLAERVVEDDVLERHAALGRFHERRGREFQAEDRLQFIDRPHAGDWRGSGATRP